MILRMQHGAQEILLFWFGSRPYSAASLKPHQRLWFGDPATPELAPQIDELIRERFGATAAAAARDELTAWADGPRRRLALVLLLDQFPRNLHRGTAAAFAQDRKALELTLSGLRSGADAALDPVERLFFYMPLQHAESRDLQAESVAAFAQLQAQAVPELQPLFAASLGYARQHHDIVERFGRFPHRNALLGRDSTPEEAEWLAGGGARFGQ